MAVPPETIPLADGGENCSHGLLFWTFATLKPRIDPAGPVLVMMSCWDPLLAAVRRVQEKPIANGLGVMTGCGNTVTFTVMGMIVGVARLSWRFSTPVYGVGAVTSVVGSKITVN